VTHWWLGMSRRHGWRGLISAAAVARLLEPLLQPLAWPRWSTYGRLAASFWEKVSKQLPC
jgi:hypothetical protein